LFLPTAKTLPTAKDYKRIGEVHWIEQAEWEPFSGSMLDAVLIKCFTVPTWLQKDGIFTQRLCIYSTN
jgi:hypothetical protein